jgi:hypothetical protein
MAAEKDKNMGKLFPIRPFTPKENPVYEMYGPELDWVKLIKNAGFPHVRFKKRPSERTTEEDILFETEKIVHRILSIPSRNPWADVLTGLIEEDTVKLYEERIKKRLYEAADLLDEYLEFADDFDKDDTFSEFIDILRAIWSDRNLLGDSQRQLVSLVMDYSILYGDVTLTDEQILFIKGLLDILNEGREIEPEQHSEIIKTGLQYGLDVSKLSRTEKGWYAEGEE